jgi:hypothetical protein
MMAWPNLQPQQHRHPGPLKSEPCLSQTIGARNGWIIVAMGLKLITTTAIIAIYDQHLL